jgi:hypothetical protein
MLRQLFISGVVAALQHGSIDRAAVNEAFTGHVLSTSVFDTLHAARFTRIYLNSIR